MVRRSFYENCQSHPLVGNKILLDPYFFSIQNLTVCSLRELGPLLFIPVNVTFLEIRFFVDEIKLR